VQSLGTPLMSTPSYTSRLLLRHTGCLNHRPFHRHRRHPVHHELAVLGTYEHTHLTISSLLYQYYTSNLAVAKRSHVNCKFKLTFNFEDEHTMRCGIFGSYQSDATSKTVKCCGSWVYSCKRRYNMCQGLYLYHVCFISSQYCPTAGHPSIILAVLSCVAQQ